MLLSYLITSRARRDLLHQLWVERAEGSVSDLARRAGVSFATAHKELESMRSEGLATSKRVGRTLVHRADCKHPQSALLRRLLKGGTATGRAQGELTRRVPRLVPERVSTG
jgi:DNA-binding transcriptional regulator YhcF (GntR family)